MGTRIIAEPNRKVAFRCNECARPFLFVQGDTLTVFSRHAGKTHVNTVTLSELLELMSGSGAAAK